MSKRNKETLIGLLIGLVISAVVIAGDQITRAMEKPATAPTVSTSGAFSGICNLDVTITTGRAVTTEKKKKKRKKKKKINKEDYEILAHVIYGEVGTESRECMYYVGAVVLNRVKSSLYPNTIKEVVYQRGQYACTWDGNFNKTPNKRAYRVAKDLLENGVKGVPKTVTGQSAVKQGEVWKAIKCTNGVTCYFCHNSWVVKEYAK